MYSLAGRCCRQQPASMTRQLSSSQWVRPCSSRRVCRSGRDPSYAAEQQQGPDMVSSLLNSCLAGTARLADTAVGRLADMLQSVAPPAAPRHKIELCVKGALVLLLLGLLKGVISFVLLVGCIGLAAYTATQVFGWSGVVLSQQGPSAYGGDHRRQQQQQYPPGPPPGQGYQQESGASWPYQQQQQQEAGWQQQQQQRQQRQQRRQQQQQQGSWPPGEQGDLVDVFHYGKPAAQ